MGQKETRLSEVVHPGVFVKLPPTALVFKRPRRKNPSRRQIHLGSTLHFSEKQTLRSSKDQACIAHEGYMGNPLRQ